MAADLALRRGSGSSRVLIPVGWAVGAAVFVAAAGTVTTVMLAIVASSSHSQFGRWLEILLPVSELLPYVLCLGLAPAAYHTWRNRSRLARRLTGIMLFQVGLAALLILLPFWALNESYEKAFEESFDDLATTSSNLSDKLLSLEQKGLDVVAVEAYEALASLGPNGSNLAQGLVIDNLRDKHQLDLVALLDKGGRIRQVSPTTGRLSDIGPYPFILTGAGEERSIYRKILDSDSSAVVLLRVEPLRFGVGRENEWLWIELTLPERISSDITTVEKSGTEYHKSRSQRSGLIKIFNLIIFNSLALLLFVSINVSVYVGTRLGSRLGNISERMESVASMPNPGVGVPVEGNDEITVVTKAFNEMVARVGETMAKEKLALADLEHIQSAIDAGLVVLDRDSRITRHNPASERLLDAGEISHGESLVDLVRRHPKLERLAKLLDEPGGRRGGEIQVGERKLWVRVASMGDSKIVLFTDISEPLALEEIRSRQEALSYTLHGIKNPLQPLLYHAESLDKLLGSLNEKDAKFLRERRKSLLHNISRINEQIEGMGKLVRNSDVRYAPVDVNAVVSEFDQHVRRPSTRCVLELDQGLAPARFNKQELHEVLENLRINAEQQFDINDLTERKTRISTKMAEGQVVLAYEDNAGGIDPDRLVDIFRPHISNKPKGQGLGLARVKAAVEGAGGEVEVANIKLDGRDGARFTIRLQSGHTSEMRFS